MMDADDFSEPRQLLCDLVSRDTTVRASAQNTVRSLSPDEQLQLLGYAERAKNPRRPFESFRKVFSRKPTFRPSPMICASILWAVADNVSDPRFIGPLLTLLADFYNLEYPRGENHSIGPPCWPITDNSPKIRIGVAKSIIIKMLDALKRTMVNRQSVGSLSLTLEQTRALLIPLKAPYRDVELSVCALDLLKETGDEEAIPAIERLADIKAATDNMKRVQQAAQECVSRLRLRAERGQQAKSLLRASGPGTSDELLRPAAEQADPTPPEELLRSAPSIQ